MGEPEVRRRALELLRQANAEREDQLVERLVTLHAMGANAVVGLDDVLQAVSDKRVEALIISDGFRHHGYIDEPSGFVVTNLARSPLAESELAEGDDVIENGGAQTGGPREVPGRKAGRGTRTDPAAYRGLLRTEEWSVRQAANNPSSKPSRDTRLR